MDWTVHTGSSSALFPRGGTSGGLWTAPVLPGRAAGQQKTRYERGHPFIPRLGVRNKGCLPPAVRSCLWERGTKRFGRLSTKIQAWSCTRHTCCVGFHGTSDQLAFSSWTGKECGVHRPQREWPWRCRPIAPESNHACDPKQIPREMYAHSQAMDGQSTDSRARWMRGPIVLLWKRERAEHASTHVLWGPLGPFVLCEMNEMGAKPSFSYITSFIFCAGCSLELCPLLPSASRFPHPARIASSFQGLYSSHRGQVPLAC